MGSHNSDAVEMASITSSNATALSSAMSLPTNNSSTINMPDEPQLTGEEIEQKPWKYIGYKGYSEFIASENDFYVLRGFRSLNTRIALALQDQITVLEQKMEQLDTQYSRRHAEDLHNGSFRYDRDDRAALLEAIASKLSLYSI